MSCSVCLLPFCQAPGAQFPEPPTGILTEKQIAYFTAGIALAFPQVIARVTYVDSNLFASTDAVVMIRWSTSDHCCFVCHRTCFHLLQVAFGCQDISNPENIITLCEIDRVLGHPEPSTEEGMGRIPFVKYEEVCGVDMRAYWSKTEVFEPEAMAVPFAWSDFKQNGPTWVLARPDIFPRLHSDVSETRLTSIGTPTVSNDAFTTLPVDVMRCFLPHLDIATYLALTSTCRSIRMLALRELQPHARRLVLSLPWSTPLLLAFGKGEYQSPLMAHSIDSPSNADWLLYLSHIHRTDSMKQRRRIWEICEEIKRAFDEQLPKSEYGRNHEAKREALRIKVIESTIAMSLMNGMNLLNEQRGRRKLEEQMARETALD